MEVRRKKNISLITQVIYNKMSVDKITLFKIILKNCTT